MRDIKEIDREYTDEQSFIEYSKAYYQKLVEKQNDTSSLACIRGSAEILREYLEDPRCEAAEAVKDILNIADSYISCEESIDILEKKLYGISERTKADGGVAGAKDELLEKKKQYDRLRDDFNKKHQKSLKSEKDIIQMLRECSEQEISIHEEAVEQLREEVRGVYKEKECLCLGKTFRFADHGELPHKVLVAGAYEGSTGYNILDELGYSDSGKEITIDYKQQGNIIISTALENIRNRSIDDFIVSYIFRMLEKFPAGSLNVHIFDKNPDIIYKRLYNGIQSGNAGGKIKNMVKLHTSAEDLYAFRDVNCDEIIRKTDPSGMPDLYAVYQKDQTDPFNLVILREGLLDNDGRISSEVADVIEYLSGKVGHVCGFRFMLIDNSSSFEKEAASSARIKLKQIEANCELKLVFENDEFSVEDEKVRVLYINGDTESFVHDQAQKIAEISDGSM